MSSWCTGSTQLLETNESDISAIVRHYALDQAALARDVTTTLDRLPRGSTAISDFSDQIEMAIERGWVYGTLMFGDAQVRSGYLLLGMLRTNSLRNALVAISRQFEKIKADDLAENFNTICAKTGESGLARKTAPASARVRPAKPRARWRRRRWASRRR
jgi:type VI secretion system protein VasG